MQPAQTLRPTYQDGRLAKGSPGTEVPEGKLDMVTHLHEVRKKKRACNTDELHCHSQAQVYKKEEMQQTLKDHERWKW